jgi:hypothetical protein
MTNPLDAWIAELADDLGVGTETVDRTLLLELARDAARGIARPAAPLTTFLVGLAAGRRGGSIADVRACAEIAGAAARRHAPEADDALG